MDNANLFKEDNDFNICKSWLCNSTEGQTYSLSDWFGNKIHPCPTDALAVEYDNIIGGCFNTQEWEDAIGFRHDFKVDGEYTDKETEKMVSRINDYIDRLNAKIDAMQRVSPDEIKNLKVLNKNKEIECTIHSLLYNTVTRDYIENIIDNIKDDVIDDVNETASPEEWNIYDVRLAIGRVLYKRLNIEV